jgi:hypothetical protein
MDGNTILALLFGFQIQLLQLIIRKGKKITQFVGHEAPQIGIRRKPRGKLLARKGQASRALGYRVGIRSVNRKT